MNDLFAYYIGTVLTYKNFGGTMAEMSLDNDGNEKKVLYPSYDVKTSCDNYRITFKFVVTDTTNRENEGIWSLYVIKAKDDVNLDVAYRGDNEYIVGIHINVANSIGEG